MLDGRLVERMNLVNGRTSISVINLSSVSQITSIMYNCNFAYSVKNRCDVK